MTKSVENRAVEYAIKYEKKQGRNARDVRKERDANKKTYGYDLKSGNRCIEVKGSSESDPPSIPLSQHNIKTIMRENNYYIYFVYNIKKEPKLIIIPKKEIPRNIRFVVGCEIPTNKELWAKSIKL